MAQCPCDESRGFRCRHAKSGSDRRSHKFQWPSSCCSPGGQHQERRWRHQFLRDAHVAHVALWACAGELVRRQLVHRRDGEVVCGEAHEAPEFPEVHEAREVHEVRVFPEEHEAREFPEVHVFPEVHGAHELHEGGGWNALASLGRAG